MRKTKKAYEAYLNELHSGVAARYLGQYMCTSDTKYGRPRERQVCWRLLNQGKYGTALRRYDPTAFEVGYREWQL